MRATVAWLLPLAAGAAAMPASLPGVADAGRARQNWILKCQGCHRADGSGAPGAVPSLVDRVGRFAALAEGRAYLARVPGVATAALGDAELAELLNWTVQRFDPRGLPRDFSPYDAAEMARLRRTPLRTEAGQVRADLLARLPSG